MVNQAPQGKLGVLIPGLGAVSTTFIAGVNSIMHGQTAPIGSLTQMGTIRLGKRTENRSPKIKEFAQLADLKDLVFGAWDIFEDNAFQAASKAQVLTPQDLELARSALEKVKPMKAVFDQDFVKNLDGPHKKSAENKLVLAEMLMDDIK
ncbi:MAG: inositol-3-phosphate synthase, partial [Candidatus Marinimicrobia bacterium]|nr:inositol-3-phosphate synthase [Candidatus Neomarinimicrobiota bacterium]